MEYPNFGESAQPAPVYRAIDVTTGIDSARYLELYSQLGIPGTSLELSIRSLCFYVGAIASRTHPPKMRHPDCSIAVTAY